MTTAYLAVLLQSSDDYTSDIALRRTAACSREICSEPCNSSGIIIVHSHLIPRNPQLSASSMSLTIHPPFSFPPHACYPSKPILTSHKRTQKSVRVTRRRGYISFSPPYAGQSSSHARTHARACIAGRYAATSNVYIPSKARQGMAGHVDMRSDQAQNQILMSSSDTAEGVRTPDSVIMPEMRSGG